jgi:serine/threonine protein kinase
MIDGYQVICELGRGAMGVVYEVQKTKVRYALKVLLGQDADDLLRFEREGQSLALVDRHPNIVSVHSTGSVNGGQPYLVLDFVEGQDLRELLAGGQNYSWQEALTLAAQIAKAIGFIHDHGILHRDLKAANILIRAKDKQPLLSDFGLARILDAERLTMTGEIVGTPYAMAPEQIEGRPDLGPGVDLWALGVLLYELLTKTQPFKGATLLQLSQGILKVDYARPHTVDGGIPKGVNEILESCFQLDPSARYGSAYDFAKDCRLAAAGKNLGASGESGAGSKKRWLWLLLIGALLGVGLVFLGKERGPSPAHKKWTKESQRYILEHWQKSLNRRMMAAIDPKPGRPVPVNRPELEQLVVRFQSLSKTPGINQRKQLYQLLLLLQGVVKERQAEPSLLRGLDRRWAPFLKALKAVEAFVKPGKQGAEEAFEALNHRRFGSLKSLALLGFAWGEGDCQKALSALEAVDPGGGELGGLKSLRLKLHEENALQSLFLDQETQQDSWTFIIQAKGAAKSAWQAWLRKFKADILSKGDLTLAVKIRAYERLDLIVRRRSAPHRLLMPMLTFDFHKALALLYGKGSKNPNARAFRQVLICSVLREDFVAPRGYRVAEINHRIVEVKFNRIKLNRQLTEIYRILRVGSQFGFILGEDSLPNLQKEGVLKEALSGYMLDPWHNFWSGFQWTKQREKIYSIKRFQQVMKSFQLAEDGLLDLADEASLKLLGQVYYWRAKAIFDWLTLERSEQKRREGLGQAEKSEKLRTRINKLKAALVHYLKRAKKHDRTYFDEACRTLADYYWQYQAQSLGPAISELEQGRSFMKEELKKYAAGSIQIQRWTNDSLRTLESRKKSLSAMAYSMGFFYHSKRQFEKATWALEKAYEERKGLGDEGLESGNHFNLLAESYIEIKDYKAAKLWLNRCEKCSRHMDHSDDHESLLNRLKVLGVK